MAMDEEIYQQSLQLELAECQRMCDAQKYFHFKCMCVLVLQILEAVFLPPP
jgi:hypothetical protein